MTGTLHTLPRPGLRIGLAVICAWNLVELILWVSETRPGPSSHPMVPLWLLEAVSSPVALALLGLGGLVAAVQFARRPGQLAAGLVLLAAQALLSETFAATRDGGGPMRHLYFAGLALAGWCGGLALERMTRTAGETRVHPEAFARAGTLGALAGVYLNAGISKLLGGGLGWADATSLQCLMLSHALPGAGSLSSQAVAYVGTHAWLAQTLAAGALLIELAAFLLLARNPFVRAAIAVSIVGMHLGILLLMHIGYMYAMALVLLFGVPWAELFRARRGGVPSTEAAMPSLPALKTAVGVVAFVIFLALLAPVRNYTALHDRWHGGAADHHAQPHPAQPHHQ